MRLENDREIFHGFSVCGGSCGGLSVGAVLVRTSRDNGVLECWSSFPIGQFATKTESPGAFRFCDEPLLREGRGKARLAVKLQNAPFSLSEYLTIGSFVVQLNIPHAPIV